MARTKSPNPLATGAIGAAGGAIIGGATGILLSNKRARQKLVSRLSDIKDYAQETITSVNDMAQKSQLRNVRLAGVKGGRTRKRLKSTRS